MLCRYEGGDAFSRSLLRLSIFLTFICCNSPSISQHDFKVNEPLKMIIKLLFVTRISLDRITKSVHGKFNCIFCGPQSWIFLVWGCLKSSILTVCPFNRNAFAPQAIGSYINSLLQSGYQICILCTMIKDNADP